MALSNIGDYPLFTGLDDMRGFAAAVSAKIPTGHGFTDLALSWLDAKVHDDVEAADEDNVRTSLAADNCLRISAFQEHNSLCCSGRL